MRTKRGNSGGYDRSRAWIPPFTPNEDSCLFTGDQHLLAFRMAADLRGIKPGWLETRFSVQRQLIGKVFGLGIFAHTERQTAYGMNAVSKVDHHAVARAADAIAALVVHRSEAWPKRNKRSQAFVSLTAADQSEFNLTRGEFGRNHSRGRLALPNVLWRGAPV